MESTKSNVQVAIVAVFLALACKTCASCNGQCARSSFLAPPPIENEAEALLQSKCYSFCMKEVGGRMNLVGRKRVNCSTVQLVESCRMSCLHRFHDHKNHQSCSNFCETNQCASGLDIKWAERFRVNGCPRLCHRDLCTVGCSFGIEQFLSEGTEANLRLSPSFHRVGRSPLYHFNLGRRFGHHHLDWSAAIVLRILDTNTSQAYFMWMPKLHPRVDLSFFSCHVIDIYVNVVFGSDFMKFPHPTSLCVYGPPPKLESQSLEKICKAGNVQILEEQISKLEKRIDKIVKRIHNQNSGGNQGHGMKLNLLETKISRVLNVTGTSVALQEE